MYVNIIDIEFKLENFCISQIINNDKRDKQKHIDSLYLFYNYVSGLTKLMCMARINVMDAP